MNVIKQGDPKKIAEDNRRRTLRTFRCPVCGCVWEASIAPGTEEARLTIISDQRDNYSAWVSDCPMEECKGTGREYNVALEQENCTECRYFNGWGPVPTCQVNSAVDVPIETPRYNTCSMFNKRVHL